MTKAKPENPRPCGQEEPQKEQVQTGRQKFRLLAAGIRWRRLQPAPTGL